MIGGGRRRKEATRGRKTLNQVLEGWGRYAVAPRGRHEAVPKQSRRFLQSCLRSLSGGTFCYKPVHETVPWIPCNTRTHPSANFVSHLTTSVDIIQPSLDTMPAFRNIRRSRRISKQPPRDPSKSSCLIPSPAACYSSSTSRPRSQPCTDILNRHRYRRI